MDDLEVIQEKHLKPLEKAAPWAFPVCERTIFVESFTQKVTS